MKNSFYVGQRVTAISPPDHNESLVGRTGTVVNVSTNGWTGVQWDAVSGAFDSTYRNGQWSNFWDCPSGTLAPLLDLDKRYVNPTKVGGLSVAFIMPVKVGSKIRRFVVLKRTYRGATTYVVTEISKKGLPLKRQPSIYKTVFTKQEAAVTAINKLFEKVNHD